ncbi:MAG: PEP/pyruvate-binding domain-containing protein [Nitrospira sp.]|jgi:phosphohistidine swiveling domain-containing protein|nr:PEP/pyruvate-binding domain-containing protein [Nitrospira sp.]
MTIQFVIPLESCSDRLLAGGKAWGLACLLAEGFPVPPGVCVTTDSYRRFLQGQKIDAEALWLEAIQADGETGRKRLAAVRDRLLQAALPDQILSALTQRLDALQQPPDQLWAVRSSATNEDSADASFAGLYRTSLAVRREQIGASVQACWASLWEDRVLEYHKRIGGAGSMPAMAVVIQPVIRARAAGVAYTIHPVTGQADAVVVNAVPGLAQGLVEGTMPPDQFVLRWDSSASRAAVRERIIASKQSMMLAGAGGMRTEPIDQVQRECPSLADEDVVALAQLAKQVETVWGHPVDVEWAMDERGIWLLQARSVTVVAARAPQPTQACEWSRTNFKETLPDVPSPLGLSFLEQFMDLFLMGPYRKLGCHIPPGLSPVRVHHGRPYLNVSLMHALIEQLHGDPSILAEHMGGQTVTRPLPVHPLGFWAMLRAGLLITWWIGQATRGSSRWFADMKQMAMAYRPDRVQALTLEDVRGRVRACNDEFAAREMTFGIAGGVTQCLQALGYLLPRWLGADWRELLNAALQGRAQAISAQQIIRLAALAEVARRDELVRRLFAESEWEALVGGAALAGTEFRRLFDEYLEDYGQRGVGESDIMSPRFADQPELVLEVLRHQVLAVAAHSPAEIAARQLAVRERALAEIRSRCGWRVHRWAVFSWWYRRLCRFFALREANRHHLMYYAGALRQLLLRAGALLVQQGVLNQREDVFFIRVEEQLDLLRPTARDWRALVQSRKEEHGANVRLTVPDRVMDEGSESQREAPLATGGLWRGIPISAGRATGPARIVRTSADWKKVRQGDILVAPVIDPGMAPLFGIAAGLVVEMGGTLSHGAIIAREYGLPAVANIPGVTVLLQDGERVEMNATTGDVWRPERSPS